MHANPECTAQGFSLCVHTEPLPPALRDAFLVAQLVENPPAMQETLLLIPRSGRSPGEGKGDTLQYSWAFLVAQTVKNPPAVRETWVRSLGWEDPLEQAKGTLSP